MSSSDWAAMWVIAFSCAFAGGALGSYLMLRRRVEREAARAMATALAAMRPEVDARAQWVQFEELRQGHRRQAADRMKGEQRRHDGDTPQLPS
ncbi:hypothetical protein [Streptomyces sp. NPDC057302]|uniref:hypothetical protein n=1 Tax=Streptomyces sp. NPDC057302 TaxID=3346094 RepID=UPI00363FE8BD